MQKFNKREAGLPRTDAIADESTVQQAINFIEYQMRLIVLNGVWIQIELVDARDDIGTAQHFREDGMSLDDGMVVVLDGSEFYGLDAVHALALLSSPSDLFNKINTIIYCNKTMCRRLYPALKMGRSLLLKMLGRRKIHH